MSTEPKGESEVSERERFEVWTIDRYHGDRGDVLSKRSDGEYVSGPMQFAFEAWQAALADRPTEEPEVNPWYGTGKIPMQRDCLEQPVAPNGWKLVPIEPTDEMLKAADREKVRELDPYRGVYTKLWQAMLAAAPPSHPAPSEAGAER